MASKKPPRRTRATGAAALRPFHPEVRRWFSETLGTPSDPQRLGWPAIASGGHTLILAPTGTGKTLAAFLWELNALISDGLKAPLPNAVQLLYISPLKALNNDIRRAASEALVAHAASRWKPSMGALRSRVRTSPRFRRRTSGVRRAA